MVSISVKGMLLHGVSNEEVMRAWLTSIKCEEYAKNFIENGYDMLLLSRMTPQDLAAIGCKSPALRKKLLLEIKNLNLEDDIPDKRPHSLEKWLELLKLGGYLARLCSEGYNTIDKVCDLTWEDLEEIGIDKLGHQKRLLLGIEKIKRFDKQQEDKQSNDSNSIYDVHPNHRISLQQQNSDYRLSTTINRATVRSGFFQTRSGANLDHRGLPVATVMPALKHVTNSLANLDITHQVISKSDSIIKNNNNILTNGNNNNNQIYSSYQATMPEQSLKMTDLSGVATIKRNPPPLPPVRTNSLKFPIQDPTQQNNIYGNTYGVVTDDNVTNGNGTNGYGPVTMGSTSFLRTPKLGTLTATTNKMLTSGGHIQQSVNGQQPTTIRSMPIREAPLPPIPTTQPPNGVSLSNNSTTRLQSDFSIPVHDTRSNLISPSSLIGHQLASADEFPPPPP